MAGVMRLALGLALVLIAPAAQADPVSIIGGLVAMWGAGAVGLTGAIGGIFGTLTYGYVAFAAGSLLFGTLNAKRQQRKAMASQRDQFNASLQERMVTALSTAAPWQIVYGQAEVGGSLEAILTSGPKDEYKHLVIVLAAHACQEIVDIAINGEKLGVLDAGGAVTTGSKWFKTETQTYSETVMFNGAGVGTLSVTGAALLRVVIPASGPTEAFDGEPEQVFDAAALTGTTITGGPVSLAAVATYTRPEADALVRVKKHLGADDQAADASLLAECATQWSATDRLRGMTYIVLRLKLTEAEFQGGPPAITAVIKGKLVYDNRTGLTAWSDNPALCVADFLRAPYGKDARLNQMVWNTVNAAANACDETITVGTWTGPRYRCDGSFRTDEDTDQTLDALLACMAGWADGGGGWRIGAGVWVPPVATLTDNDNAGAVQIVGGEGLDELFNGVRGQYSDPLRFGVATDFTPYQNAAFVAVDGRALWVDMALPFTRDGTRARNLARINVERSRGETLSYPAKIGVLNRMRVGERVLVTCSGLGISSASYRLQQRDEQPGGPVMLTLTQDVAGNWDTVDAAAPVPTFYAPLPDPFAVPAPVGLSAVSGEAHALVAGATVLPRILVSVSGEPQQLTDQLEVQWRPSASNDWQSLQVRAGQRSVYIETVSEGVTYFVRARWSRPIVGAFGDWRVVAVTVTGKTTAPAAFDVFTVTELDNGTRRYAFGYTVTAKPVDWRGAEIRWIAGTHAAPDWATMTPLANSGTYYTASPVETLVPVGTGPFTFACRSRDSGGLSAMKLATATLLKDGVPAAKYATAYLYQWATAQPGNPSGTSTYTWATGASSAYSGAAGWSNTIPANPGTPGLKLWTAAKQVTDFASAVSTAVSWASGFSVVANSQNGADGLQTAQPAVYQWAATIPTIAGTATYTWATSAFTAPAGWSLTIGAAPTPGFTLWKATAAIVDAAGATTTAINWATAGIVAAGYAGGDGLSARICFARVASNPTPVAGTIVTAGSGGFPSSTQSTTTWGFAATWGASDPAPGSSNSLYQSDGIFNPATDQTSWGTPYISSLKVGSLSAITVNTGALTVSDALTVGTTGSMKGGQTSYNTGTGWWLGYAAGVYTFSLGSATQGLTWDGTKLSLKGGLYVGSNNSIQVNDATGSVVIYQLTGSNSVFSNSANGGLPAADAQAGAGAANVALLGRSIATHGNGHAIRGSWYGSNGFGGAPQASGLVGATNGKAFHAEAGTAGPFTGSHDVALPNGVEIEPGSLVVDETCLLRKGWSNNFFSVKLSTAPNQPGVIGVFTHSLGPVNRYSVLSAASGLVMQIDPEASDYETVYGSPEFEVIKDLYYVGEVNSLGEGQVLVCGEAGDLEAGDLIVTSSMPGKGMKQADDIVRSYTVAKIREAVTFSIPTEVKTVACIYLCG